MTSDAVVEFTDVGKTFPNGSRAVDGLTCSLREGEFVSLLGPSGCGKSTALRMIAGLSAPTSGTVRRAWDDEPRSTSLRRPLACVFQDSTLMPWATVWNNVYLPLRLAGVSRGKAKGQVDEAIERVGLAGFAHSYPRQLSGGMRMRAAVARALVTHPRVLLLDEPLAALDEITRERLNDELHSLWRERRWTALLITHSVFESVYLSTRVLVMSPRPGRIVEEIASQLPDRRTAALRTTPAYLELCSRVSAALERAMNDEPPAS